MAPDSPKIASVSEDADIHFQVSSPSFPGNEIEEISEWSLIFNWLKLHTSSQTFLGGNCNPWLDKRSSRPVSMNWRYSVVSGTVCSSLIPSLNMA
ncbi:unnamed protein product [Allacma fusca]|uniref:Uncharacterized protein n=1 Tax=Allacma fusca TaxID=39272 RepID=A0A8J2LA71_9HEXA|nr:unnamed protein product [Allacma fusca]